MPPRNTRRYFEELDKQLKGRSPQSPEFEALLKSKIGGQFQELVTPENLEKMYLLGRPEGYNRYGGVNARAFVEAKRTPAEIATKLEKDFSSVLREGEKVPEGKTIIGIGRRANPNVFTHELRHELSFSPNKPENEIKNRFYDLIYGSTSYPAYLTNIRRVHEATLHLDPEFKRGKTDADFARRRQMSWYSSDKEKEKHVLKSPYLQELLSPGKEGVSLPSRAKNLFSDIVNKNYELNVSGVNARTENLPKDAIELRSKFPFLNFVGSPEMENALPGLKVRPKRRANGSPRTGETSADLLRSIPTSPSSGAPIKQPGWSDLESYDPQVLSAAAGRGITGALEGTSQMLGGARDYLSGFMQSVRERSPAELQGTAPARSKETYESVNRAVSQAAQDPRTTAKNLASAVVDVGIQAAKSPASMTEFIASNITPGGRSKPVMTQVVKPKGGDFLAELDAIEKIKFWELDGNGPPGEKVINSWLDTKLSKYVRNEMATPEDSIRKLAEQGILHVDPEQINFDIDMYGRSYGLGQSEGTELPRQLMAKSDTAKIWEGAADNSMGYNRVGDLAGWQSSGDPAVRRFFEQNSWIAEVAKKDPDRKLYIPSEELGRDLGFNHLRDELFNSIDAESRLPQQLRLTNEQLGRMSVPDAVRHVSKINKWREKQKAEANFALANNAATVPFKDYPDQKYGWYQLKVDTPEGREALQEALRYEGDVMGHCVGGYCDDVLSGRSKIYSLRDKKTGAPHVTIEVVPPVDPYGLDSPDRLMSQTRAEYREYIRQWRVRNPNVTGELDSEQMGQALKEAGVPPNPPVLEQIKGKGNKKPKDEYLPFVQDFVRSGRWDSVEELDNAGLVDLMRYSAQFPLTSTGRASKQELGITQRHILRQTAIMQLQEEGLRYVTPQELQSRVDALTPPQQ